MNFNYFEINYKLKKENQWGQNNMQKKRLKTTKEISMMKLVENKKLKDKIEI